jgi:hypothetical protein
MVVEAQMAIVVYTLLAVIAGTLVVPFVIGLVKGPDPNPVAPHPAGTASMRPLSRVSGVYGRFLALYYVAATVSLATGQRGSVCATLLGFNQGTAHGYPGLPGAVVRPGGTIQACAVHPDTGQWLLHVLMVLPGPMLWTTVLLMIWQLVREARRNGPFTARTATIMWRLGLVVLIGTVVAGALSRLGNDLLLSRLLADPPFIGLGVPLDALLSGGPRALLPVPLLAGAGLLTFARVTREGVVLDEEVRATV